MGKSKINLSGFQDRLETYCQNVCRIAAGQIRDELTEEAMYSIAAFYSDYSPIKYHRHYYNFMDNSYKKYYSNAHNKIYRGGVEFTPEAMDNIYQKGYSTGDVFNFVVGEGSHGPLPWTTVSPMSPSPMEMIEKKRDEIYDNINEYIESAKAKVKF